MRLFDKIFGKTKGQKEEVTQPFVNPKDILFTIPTVSNEFPQTTDVPEKAAFDTEKKSINLLLVIVK